MNSLRPVTEADSAQLLRWRNLPDVRRYMKTDHVISQAEHERWFASLATNATREDWIIQSDGEDVGLLCLVDIDRRHRRCSWAFYLASPNVRGKGVGSAVEYFTLRRVFDIWGFEKLCCEVIDFNAAVVGMHKKFGFVEEGRLRRHIEKDGEFHDVFVLGMLRAEWEAGRAAIEERLLSKGELPEVPDA